MRTCRQRVIAIEGDFCQTQHTYAHNAALQAEGSQNILVITDHIHYNNYNNKPDTSRTAFSSPRPANANKRTCATRWT